ncbi:hypothetical protein QQF64_017515 [Cirrhinus molitorella]|uniref:Uncharacterized protein n=1 Tax=Cirrhinus molitorella TaxID=172907 RepID=A0ABR3LMH6_9TELE
MSLLLCLYKTGVKLKSHCNNTKSTHKRVHTHMGHVNWAYTATPILLQTLQCMLVYCVERRQAPAARALFQHGRQQIGQRSSVSPGVCLCVRKWFCRKTLASPAQGSYPRGSNTRHQLLPSSCAFIKAVSVLSCRAHWPARREVPAGAHTHCSIHSTMKYLCLWPALGDGQAGRQWNINAELPPLLPAAHLPTRFTPERERESDSGREGEAGGLQEIASVQCCVEDGRGMSRETAALTDARRQDPTGEQGGTELALSHPNGNTMGCRGNLVQLRRLRRRKCCHGEVDRRARDTVLCSTLTAAVLPMCVNSARVRVSEWTGSEVMTSSLQPLDFLSQQQRVFPSAGNLCPVSLLV